MWEVFVLFVLFLMNCGLRFLLLLRKTHLGELSFFNKLRWKRDGARHTARFLGVIWFSSTKLATSLRKHRSVCRTSLLSSASSRMAACTACSRCSSGTSVDKWVPGHQRNSHRKSQLGKKWVSCTFLIWRHAQRHHHQPWWQLLRKK